MKTTRNRVAAGLLAVSAVLLQTGCASEGGGPEPEEPVDDVAAGDATEEPDASTDECSMESLYEAAQEEGMLVRWGGQDPEDMAVVYDAFSEEYPGIDIQDAIVNPDEVPTRLLTEKSAGNDPPDLFQGRVNFLQPLIEAGALEQDPGWEACGARESIVQPDGGLTENIQLYALAYNTDRVEESELPSTWEELADPKYSGMLSVDPRGLPFDILALAGDEQAAVDLVTDLKETVNPVLTQGGTAGLAQVASGEVAMRPALVPDIKASQATGAPVEIHYLTPVPVLRDAVYMPTDVAHPNAARLFALWYTSEDGGQAITRERNFRDNSDPTDLPEGAEEISVESAEDAEVVGSANEQIVGIWGGQ